MHIKRYKAFWLLEILFIIIIMSIWLFSILQVVETIITNTSSIREKMIATSLAKEGIESVYQIRNFNLMLNQDDENRNACWLAIDPLDCVNNTGSSPWIQSDSIYILNNKVVNDVKYFYLTGNQWSITWIDLNDGIEANEKEFALCLNSNWWDACDSWYSWFRNKYWTFFRIIKGVWLYDKSDIEGWAKIENCDNASNNTICSNWLPKEFRFCSTVYYAWLTVGKSEFCGIITNFF